MAVQYLGTGNDDGVNFGRSTDKIGFYGLATPIVKPSLTTTNSTVASQVALVLSSLGLVTIA